MVTFGATTTLFIFFLDVQCFGKENTDECQTFRSCQALTVKRKIQFYAVCSSVLKKDDSSSAILSDEEYEEFSDKYQFFCSRSECFNFCLVELLSPSICIELSEIRYSGFMDPISRLPPPGGTTALDIFRTVLVTSYHLSSCFMKEFQSFSFPSLRVDIVFDADYEAVIGDSAMEFRSYLLWHLKRIFRRSQSDIHKLSIKKGSIGITFFINLVNCAHSKKSGNRCTYSQTNLFHEQRKMPPDKVITDMDYDETEFLGFLRYLNYHLSFKHYNLLRRVPYSVKTSSSEKSWPEKLNVLDIDNIDKMDILGRKDFPFPETFSTSQSFKEKQRDKPSNVPVKKSKPSTDGKENLLLDHFGGKQLHLNRIRRYVAREDESIMKLKVEFQLEKPAKNGNKDDFQTHLVSQLAKAMRVPIPSIKDLKITSDTDVSFTLSAYNDENNIMDDVNVIEAADSLKAKIKSQQLRLNDMNGQLLMTAGSAYASVDESSDYSIVILIILGITLLVLAVLIIMIIYIARRTSRTKRRSSIRRNEAYKNVNFGRDSSQSIGKYSYDSGLWLGPGPEPNFTVPDAPFYRPPTVEQIASTPRPVTAVRTRLKRNWNVDERALSTIPDDFGRKYVAHESPPPR